MMKAKMFFCILLICCPGLVALAGPFTLEKGEGAVTVRIDGELFTRYVLEGEGGKPYFWPLLGPDGVPMTRSYPMAEVDGEKTDHPHHRSMYFGHQDVGGVNTWHERLSFAKQIKNGTFRERLGSTETSRILTMEAGPDYAVLETQTVYRDDEGKRVMEDERRFIFRVDPDGDARIVDVEITFVGTEPSVTIGDIKDAGFSIRVASSMAVDAGKGGRIVNSKGDVNKAAWGKRARWCDFNGPVDGQVMGIAVLQHPDSLQYPNPWHVRTYGLLTANPFGCRSVAGESEGCAVTLKQGERAVMKYRVILHRGDEQQAAIESAFQAYAGRDRTMSPYSSTPEEGTNR